MAINVKPLPPLNRLRELFTYDPETGELRNRVARKTAPAGALFGARIVCAGIEYRHGHVDGEQYYAHRIAYALTHNGLDCDTLIDHKDGCGTTNCVSNMRAVDQGVNMKNKKRYKNNTSGYAGVRMFAGKWTAQIRVGGKRKWLGAHDTLDAAIAARQAAERQYGFTARHGVEA